MVIHLSGRFWLNNLTTWKLSVTSMANSPVCRLGVNKKSDDTKICLRVIV
jgi:hypothetical protein